MKLRSTSQQSDSGHCPMEWNLIDLWGTFTVLLRWGYENLSPVSASRQF